MRQCTRVLGCWHGLCHEKPNLRNPPIIPLLPPSHISSHMLLPSRLNLGSKCDHCEIPHHSSGSLKAIWSSGYLSQLEQQPFRTYPGSERTNLGADLTKQRFGQMRTTRRWAVGWDLHLESKFSFRLTHLSLHISDCKCNHRQISPPSLFSD